jgi:hypothetical protein
MIFDPNPTPNSLPHAMGPQVEAPMAGPQQLTMDPEMMKRLADALRDSQAGQVGSGTGRMVGKHFVPTTGLQHLSNLAGAAGSAYLGAGAGGGAAGGMGSLMSFFGK